MSRVAKAPISIPSGIEVIISGQEVTLKSGVLEVNRVFNDSVEIFKEENVLRVKPRGKNDSFSLSQSGTARSLLNNMVIGVTKGFEKKLSLVGVGYRCSVKGSIVNLNLGFSHPVEYKLPEGITAESNSQTELIIKGVDKQSVGQVAANIRSFRPPEAYKGKGVRYSDEVIIRKEAKKK